MVVLLSKSIDVIQATVVFIVCILWISMKIVSIHLGTFSPQFFAYYLEILFWTEYILHTTLTHYTVWSYGDSDAARVNKRNIEREKERTRKGKKERTREGEKERRSEGEN